LEPDPNNTLLPLILKRVIEHYNALSEQKAEKNNIVSNPFQSSVSGPLSNTVGVSGDEYNNEQIKKYISSELKRREVN